MIKKISQNIGDKNLSDFGVEVMSEEEENKDFDGIEQGLADELSRTLKLASEGIEKGVNMDLASKKGQYSIFGDIAEFVTAPINLTTPSRRLERALKNEMDIFKSNSAINQSARSVFSQKIVDPSAALCATNFMPFLNVAEKIDQISKSEKNDITNISKTIDSVFESDISETPLSSKSAYKIILNQIIPILREKFDAVASFDKIIGGGDKIDHIEVAQSFLEGMEDEEDVAALIGFYKAITEWSEILEKLEGLGRNKSTKSDTLRGAGRERGAEASPKEKGDKDNISSKIKGGIYIRSVIPGQYVEYDNESKQITISDAAIKQGLTPVLKLVISGAEADSINASGSGEDYLDYFISNRTVTLSNSIMKKDLILNVTRETVPEGAEISLYLNPSSIVSAKSAIQNRLGIMTVSTTSDPVYVYADDHSVIDSLKKISSTDTTPYYQAVSPSGETVTFTPADLVISGGKLKDSKGKKFKPKRIKSKSLSDRIMSKNYGKVKKK